MSEHTAAVTWIRGDQPFTDRRYSRSHDWSFDGGARVRGSSAPTSVAVPMSDAAAVDPEEALVAAVSSCHMLFFLDFAARAGLVVDRYEDMAAGILERDTRGRMSITQIALRPRVTFAGSTPDQGVTDTLHHQAHEACFIANSIRADVRIEPR
ncbi:OsmC family peroxiredoxin [Rhizobium sp. CRIBSB]|nr:OsmC family peroxiredoxin [Rhizobium sp. CRIBSB]